uniref:Uncharacterized protein n=1 Tax=Aegilops tauschii subsp. strangulata TaxID=200361 RepID=A0A452Z3X9_AEGTS
MQLPCLQICFVSVFFSDDEDEPADPNIILEEPDDEASKSDKDVSDATGLPLDFYRGQNVATRPQMVCAAVHQCHP